MLRPPEMVLYSALCGVVAFAGISADHWTGSIATVLAFFIYCCLLGAAFRYARMVKSLSPPDTTKGDG